MSSFTDRCELEDETDRLELVTGSRLSLAYDRRTGELVGQVCAGLPQDRPGYITALSLAGYSAVHVSTITIERV